MKSGSSRSGFTIIETMIYLAVTGTLLAVAIAVIGGQQGRAQFSQAIHDLDSQIQDVMNDVSTGFYPSNNKFNCVPDGPNAIKFDNNPGGSANEAGSNSACIFIGRGVQFNTPSDAGVQFRVYTIVGQRQETSSSGSQEVTQLSNTHPRLAAYYAGGGSGSLSLDNDITEFTPLHYGLVVKKIITNENVPKTASGVAFMTSFAKYNNKQDLISGTQSVDLVGIDVGGTSNDTKGYDDFIKNLGNNTPAVNSALAYGTKGMIICLVDASTSNRTAAIIIGADQGRLTTRLEIDAEVLVNGSTTTVQQACAS